jgi:hypothetical protein
MAKRKLLPTITPNTLESTIEYMFISSVTTLTLGSQPRQGFTKVRAKSEAQKSHFMFPKVWESVRE